MIRGIDSVDDRPTITLVTGSNRFSVAPCNPDSKPCNPDDNYSPNCNPQSRCLPDGCAPNCSPSCNPMNCEPATRSCSPDCVPVCRP